jgi:hypothetical protein
MKASQAVTPITKQLDQTAIRATLIEPMRKVTEPANPRLDIWPYVKAVPVAELRGFQLWDDFVDCVYRSGDDRFDLVHVCTRTPNVFLVIVVERVQAVIHGHHLLELNELYGISPSTARSTFT